MKITLAFFVGLIVANAMIVPPDIPGLDTIANMLNKFLNKIELPDIMYFPDDSEKPTAGKIVGDVRLEPVKESDVFFRLYTRNGPKGGVTITPGDHGSLMESNFNASQPTFINTHGFFQSINSNAVKTITEMYVIHIGGNVIAVDWSKISKNPLYFIAKRQTTQVGQYVAAFVAFLVREAGLDVSDLHLSGLSLGAHVVGIAGKNICIILGKKPGRITGLDPAGPLYSMLDREHRLDRDDADFVDVIHTCSGWLGIAFPIGHVDFYPNGGIAPQPGCIQDIVNGGVCSHGNSWRYFAESINSLQFKAKACTTYIGYLTDTCNEEALVPMGQHTPKNNVIKLPTIPRMAGVFLPYFSDRESTRGNFYLKTAKSAPFALG